MDRKRIKGKVKEFDPGLAEHFDTPAREKILAQLPGLVRENPDPYGQDLVIECPECQYRYLELQVCNQWIGDDFPYDQIYIYSRKAYYGPNTLFLTMNRHLTRGYLFDLKGVEEWKPRRFKKWSREWVYDIPWENTSFIWIDAFDQFSLMWA